MTPWGDEHPQDRAPSSQPQSSGDASSHPSTLARLESNAAARIESLGSRVATPHNGAVQKLRIDGPAGKLEAALRQAERPRAAAVLAHPHPLYGGTLHNPVIFHADRELYRRGLTTLRFNFRGVGESEGAHDDGRGEVADLAAAAGWLRALAMGSPLFVVGYSFGSRAAASYVLGEPATAGLVVIGMPVRLWRWDDVSELHLPLAAVQGTNDEFGSVAEVEAVIRRAQPPGTIYEIAGATHLFPGRAPEVGTAVANAVDAMLAGQPRSTSSR